VDNYTKELNTLTNITTYTGQSSLYYGQNNTPFEVNLKAVIYPNGTGLVYTTER
jgi:hypothetical protein